MLVGLELPPHPDRQRVATIATPKRITFLQNMDALQKC
jgi:hypothetical protein